MRKRDLIRDIFNDVYGMLDLPWQLKQSDRCPNIGMFK